MSKVKFSKSWVEIQPPTWQWLMWDTVNDNAIGWIVEIREEEFRDRTTGEVRRNLVCYMLTEDGNPIRFIVPTDLRFKLDALKVEMEKKNLDWNEVLVKIVYEGKAETSKGYKVKTFKVFAKDGNMPKDFEKRIPELPLTEEEALKELQENY